MHRKRNGNWRVILVAFFLGLSLPHLTASGLLQPIAPSGVASVLQTTNIWVVHFHFTSEAWKTLQPEPPVDGPLPARGPEGPQLTGGDGRRNGLSGAQGLDFKYVRADLEIGTNEMKTVAVRLKGNSSFMQSEKSLKHSIKVDLNEFVKGQKFGTMTKLNFHNSVADPSWMNEVLSYQLYRDAGVPAPRTAYAKVYVTVPGEHNRTYLGLYGMVEDVDRPFASDHFGSKKGTMFKPVTHKPFEYLGEDWAKYRQIYDPKWELSDDQAHRLIGLCKLVSKADDQEFASRISSYVDMDEFCRFMAVTTYLSTLDSILGMGQNYYLHLHPVLQNFQFIPWDLDNSFGQFPILGTQEQREQLSLQKPWAGENRFLERMFKLSSFQTFYKTHLQTFRVTLFRPERLERQVDMIAQAIRKAVSEESPEKLTVLEKAVKGENVHGFHMAPGHPGGAGPGPDMTADLKPVKAFVRARYQSLADQMGGKSDGLIVERRFGGPRGFGPGMVMAPEWLQRADANKDGKVSREEWLSLASKWHTAWSKEGKLGLNELRVGIEAGFPPPEGIRPPEGPGPGAMMCRTFLNAMDEDKDGQITQKEFQACFAKWFERWAGDGTLDESHLREGIDRELGPGPSARFHEFQPGPPNGQ